MEGAGITPPLRVCPRMQGRNHADKSWKEEKVCDLPQRGTVIAVDSIKDLSLREKIGQTYILEESVYADLQDKDAFFENYQPGGVWFGSGKPTTCAEMRAYADSINARLKVPALFGGDAETGFGRSKVAGLSYLPCAAALGSTASEELSYEYGAINANEGSAAGFNWIWGPVVDMPCDSVSKLRELSDYPEMISKMAASQHKGMLSEHVAACAKHFPGTDGIEYRNSHFCQSAVSTSLAEWKEKQGKIFQDMIDAGVPSIMTSHRGFPAVDDRRVGRGYMPTSLSYAIITKLLKEEMGFRGVVVTDDLYMRGIKNVYDREKLYIEVVNAGNDMILGTRSTDYIDIIEAAVRRGDIAESRIDDACSRVLAMKARLGLFQKQNKTWDEEHFAERSHRFKEKVAKQSLHLVCDDIQKLPFDPEKIQKAAIVCFSTGEAFYGALSHMKDALGKYGIETHIQHNFPIDGVKNFGVPIDFDERKNETQGKTYSCKELDEKFDLIIYALFSGGGRPSFYGGEERGFFDVMSCGSEKSVVVSFGTPQVYFDWFSDSDIFLNAYDYLPEMQENFVKALFGETEPTKESQFRLVPKEFIAAETK